MAAPSREQNFFPLVKREYQQKHSIQKALKNIWEETKDDPYYEYFIRRPRENSTEKDREMLLDKITRIYSAFDQSIFCWPENTCYEFDFVSTNPRYGIKFYVENSYRYRKEIRVEIMDFFHQDKTKSLCVENCYEYESEMIACVHNGEYKLYQFNENRAILIGRGRGGTPFRLIFYLLATDLFGDGCWVLDEKELEFDNFLMIFNENYFVLHDGENRQSLKIKMGCIENDKIIFEEKEMNIQSEEVNFYSQGCYKLLDDGNIGSFQIVKKKYDVDPLIAYFKYYEIYVNQEEAQIVEKFDVKLEFDINIRYFLAFGNYVWSENKCYTYFTEVSNTTHYIICFDLDIQKCHLVQTLYLYSILSVVRQRDFSTYRIGIDENDILTFYGRMSICRLPLRIPETLKNLTWFKIRHESVFYGSNLYKQGMKYLPQNDELQPFSVPF